MERGIYDIAIHHLSVKDYQSFKYTHSQKLPIKLPNPEIVKELEVFNLGIFSSPEYAELILKNYLSQSKRIQPSMNHN